MVPSPPSRPDPRSSEPGSSPPSPSGPAGQRPPSYLYAGTARATVHFFVHPELAEVHAFAADQGWVAAGWDQVSIAWLEMHYSTDGWKTTRVLKSTDVPSPVINGYFYLPHVTKGDRVEFAVKVGLAARHHGDAAGERASGALWFNNGGQNYTQTAR